MQRSVNILWVDDEWLPDGTGSLRNDVFIEWEDRWKQRLARENIRLHIVRSAGGQIADALTTYDVAAIVLDYELDQRIGPDSNASEAIARLSAGLKRSLPPVIIFSKSKPDDVGHITFGTGQLPAGAFEKTDDGANGVGELLAALLTRGPLTFLVMSDLHAGFLPTRPASDGVLTHAEFFASLTDAVRQLAGQHRIDAVVFPGDFAWRNQREDFKLASIEVEKIRTAAGVRTLDRLLFCPGNHDMVYGDAGTASWEEFREFMALLAAGCEEAFFPRFVSSCSKSGRLRRFDAQESSLTAVVNEKLKFAFVGFNSCKPGPQRFECIGEVNEDQWTEAEHFMKSVPEHYLRIAALHHPVFSPPSGFWSSEAPVLNQGLFMQNLARLGFGLVLHGHTHFAGVHSHRINVLNRPGAGFSQGATVRTLVVSCPSVMAEPNPASPIRQFYLVRLGAPDPKGDQRSFALDSFVFEPSQKKWTPGEGIAEGEYRV